MRLVSKQGINLIAKFESFRGRAYFATKDEEERDISTIGYGHVILDGEEYLLDHAISLDEAKELLTKDLAKFCEGVSDRLNGTEEHLSQHQYDACVSLAFNIGLGGFGKSDVLKKILAGNRRDAGKSFKNWTLQSGVRLKGLVRRRAVEKILYETGKDRYTEVFDGTIDPYKELDLQ